MMQLRDDHYISAYDNVSIRDGYVFHPTCNSITYDPEKMRFVVNRGWEYNDREFTTKRSAQRFLKRWEDKQNGVVTKKKDITKKLIEAQKRVREQKEWEIQMAEERRKMEEHFRLLTEQAEQARMAQEEAELEDNYFERLGV